MNDKDLIEKIKLLFSTMFARRMSYVAIGVPGRPDNEWIFSNIPYEEMEIYNSDPNYYIHSVTITDKEFYDAFMDRFTPFKECVLLVDASKFMTIINKNTKSLDGITTYVADGDLYIQKDSAVIPCGRLISEHMADQYYEAFKPGVVDVEFPFVYRFKDNEFNLTGVTIFPILGQSLDSLYGNMKTKWMFIPGMTAPNIPGINKVMKYDETRWNMTLVSGGNLTCTKVHVVYECPICRVISTNPAMRYFAIKTEEKNHE